NVRSAAGPWLEINGFFDYNPFITMIPATERLSAMANYNRKINESLRLLTEFSYVSVETDSQAAPTPLFGDMEDVLVKADNPFNDFGEDVFTRWRMLEAGPRKTHLETDSYRLLVGLEGTLGEWDWNGAAIYSRSKSVDKGENLINLDALIEGVEAGEINPFGTTPNDVDSLKATTDRTAISTLKSVDFNITSDIYELAAGPMALALGAEYRIEALDDQPDALSEAGRIIGSGGTSSKGDRNLKALYAELSVPILDTLEAQLAMRHERYSDFGNTTNPKIALRYQPFDWLMVRGSWGTGFRAPSLAEIHLGESVAFPFLEDTKRCAVTGDDADCGGSQYKTVFSGNPDLQPEESDNLYLGVVVEPLEGFTIGVDYWYYKHTDRIDSDTQYLLDHEDAFPGKVVRADPAFPGDPGEILRIDDTFLNLTEQETDGFDFDIQYNWSTDSWGDFKVRGVGTYVRSFKRRAAPGEPLEELAGTYNRPRFRGNLSMEWNRNDWGAFARVSYIGSYDDLYTDHLDRVVDVDAMTTVDAQVSYTGFDSLTLRLGVDNLFDEEPPFANGETEGYDIAIHDPTGRFIYGRVKWAF
ncbi:MAG TPA: TonB-dependent receptor, partial [Chromatiaceae bacterium]|nr:TonB-dependent receptor [Chromatiaceae bacterium]